MSITLATLADATEQEVFTQVKEHLLKQNRCSYEHGTSSCVYKNNEGLKCAAGCLIADDEYSLSMENRDWRALIRDRVVPKKHHELIKTLQNIHDAVDAQHWSTALAGIAAQYGLTY